MEQQTLSALRKRLDAKVLSISEMIKKDIYDNIIVSTVRDWFEGNDSILILNNNIKKNVEDRCPSAILIMAIYYLESTFIVIPVKTGIQ